MSHQNVSSKCLLQMSPPNVSSKFLLKMSPQNATSKCLIKMTHQNVSSKCYIESFIKMSLQNVQSKWLMYFLCFLYFLYFLYCLYHLYHLYQRVPAILLNGWIFPIGGGASGRVCACSLRSRLAYFIVQHCFVLYTCCHTNYRSLLWGILISKIQNNLEPEDGYFLLLNIFSELG